MEHAKQNFVLLNFSNLELLLPSTYISYQLKCAAADYIIITRQRYFFEILNMLYVSIETLFFYDRYSDRNLRTFFVHNYRKIRLYGTRGRILKIPQENTVRNY